MNASDLNELMTGVPISAWPEGVLFEVGQAENADGTDTMDLPMFVLELDGLVADEDGEKWKLDQEAGSHEACEADPLSCPLPVHQASLMFIGSMTAELHRRGYSVDSYATEAGGRVICRRFDTGKLLGGVQEFTGASIVAALAAACKEEA